MTQPSRGWRWLGVALLLVLGLVIGLAGAFVQAQRVLVEAPWGPVSIPWGVPVVWFALLAAIRGGTWAVGTRWGGWAVLAGWLVVTVAMSAESGVDTVGVLFCDVDNLKPINDSRGHLVGDAVLAAVAERLSHGVRHGDLVGRVGGDEFVVVVEGVAAPEELARVAAKVQATASRPVVVDGVPVDVTISVGAVLARNDEDTDAVLVRADAALYEAKQSGRNRVAVH